MTARVLPDHARDRLAKLLGMLGSDHAAEVATFGTAAHNLIRQHDLTWAEVLQPQRVVVVEERRTWTPPPPPHDDGWRDAVSRCLCCSTCLNTWENEFLSGLPSFASLSPKQTACLHEIYIKLFGADS